MPSTSKNHTKTPERNLFTRIYKIVDQIPAGKVVTYGQIARKLGNPRLAQVVGWALHVNPSPIKTPCHRVVNREGKLAENFGFGGWETQQELLKKEGITFETPHKVDLKKFGTSEL
ncbi:MAG: MGMT family protein [bacterium]